MRSAECYGTSGESSQNDRKDRRPLVQNSTCWTWTRAEKADESGYVHLPLLAADANAILLRLEGVPWATALSYLRISTLSPPV